jgi:hypothetical protein
MKPFAALVLLFPDSIQTLGWTYKTKVNIAKYSLLSSQYFFDLEEIVFENLNISENNIN